MSLKVIKINGNFVDEFTIDSTLISVDSIDITVDESILDLQEYTIKVPYRFFTSNIKLLLWNEIKQSETILNINVTENKGEMAIKFQHPFEDGETYEVKVTDTNNKLIWRGKILATIQDDLENYILHKVEDNIIKI